MNSDFSKSEYDAIIVGSGPNGLSCAIELARHGLSVVVVERNEIPGGGAKTAELTLPGFHHDVCSTVHPLGIASPFFKSISLEKHGLKWIHSPVEVAHPFEDGDVSLLKRSVPETARLMGRDEGPWLKLFEHFARNADALMADILAPPIHFPKTPGLFAMFGMKALLPADVLTWKYFKDERARGLFTGIAAHSCADLSGMATSAVGIALTVAGHGRGWPFPEGGSKNITLALIDCLYSSGGEVVTGIDIQNVDELPQSKWVFFDLTPKQILKIAGHHLPPRIVSSYNKFLYGPGIFKIDWALDGPIPWKNPETAKAATVHLGGNHEHIVRAEAAVQNGGISDKPFVLLVQPTLFDQTRAPPGKHIAWAYCHVPNGSNIDRTGLIEDQIERYAPGFKKLILKKHILSPEKLEAQNPNLIGGDIAGGLVDARQLFFRPRIGLHPYRLDGKKFWICSSSTPPGPGVHGMSGYHAAHALLKTNDI